MAHRGWVSRARVDEAAGAKEFEQVVEFTDFDRPHRVHVHIVEGPQPVDGTWTFTPDGQGTRVDFVAEGQLQGFMRFAEPVVKRVMGRQFSSTTRTFAGTSRPRV